MYFGGILGLWATPIMSMTHLVFAIGLTAYFVVGAKIEEKDLIEEIGQPYQQYRREAGMFLPKLFK